MSKRFDASTIDLPPEINRAAWVNWCEDRKERRKPLTTRGAVLAINKLLPFTLEEQAEAVRTAIDCGWTGLFPKKSRTSSFVERITDRSWSDGL